MYVQYACDFSSVLEEHQMIAILAICIGLIACFAFIYTIHYIRKAALINYKIWDLDTVTSGDFTVIVTLPPIIWRKWNRREMKETMRFKEYF